MSEPKAKRVLIIGGGLGGLAVGSYLAMNGYRPHILEMSSQCGGVAVTWRRGDYWFDGASNYLPGSSPALNVHRVLGELLDFSRMEFYDYPEFICIESSGQVLHVYTDADRLRDELLRIAPEDQATIDLFIDGVKQFGTFDLPIEQAPETFTPLDAVAFLAKHHRLLLFRRKWGAVSIRDFAQRFTNRELRGLFLQIFPHHEHFAVMAPMAPLGWMHRRCAGYALGGSRKIIELMEERYRRLGGTVECSKPVREVLVENGRARGLRCADGSSYRGELVVSAADLHTTIFELLGGRYVPRAVRRKFERYQVFSALVQVSLGVARSFRGEPEKLNIPLLRPLRLGDHVASDLMVRILSFDPCYAPPGKTSVVVQLRTTDWRTWCELRAADRRAYRREKQRVADAVIATLDARFGAVAANVEVVDVATPATYVRYTNLWQGAHQGWAPTPGVIGMPQPKTLRGLRDFYLTGHWLSPAGGIPAVVAMGRQVAQIICKRDGRPFSISPHPPRIAPGDPQR